MPNQDEWKWHLWHLPKNGPRKYVGFFLGEKEALAHKRSMDKPEDYKILNYGPLGLAKASGTHKINKVGKPTTSKAEAAMAEARAEARRRDEESRQERDARQARERRRKAADQKAMADIASEAGDLVEQHKQDEADDLAAGINR